MKTLNQYNETLKTSKRYSNLKVSEYGKNLYKCYDNCSIFSNDELTSDEKWMMDVINQEIFETRISSQKKLVSILPTILG